MLEEFSVWVQPSFMWGKRKPRGARDWYQGSSRRGPFLWGKVSPCCTSFQAEREACEKASIPGPGPDPRPLLPACSVPTPSQPQASLCKPFSSACLQSALPHGSLELDKIFYDPTLRYALLKAPMLASAGASARPVLELPPQTPAPATISHWLVGELTAATPPPPPPLTEQGPQPWLTCP